VRASPPSPSQPSKPGAIPPADASPRSGTIEALLDRIAGLPPAGIYLAIAAIAALENIFPPVPADTAAALGGFLAARNPHLSVWVVWAVTVAGNAGSATAIYLFAGRVGRRFLDSRLGRRVMSPQLVARVQTEFEQHQVWGIFVSRCLPVYRAVVPALSGILHIPARRAIPAIVVASALFYGLVVWLAYTLGNNWAAVKHLLANLGLGLVVVAGILTITIAWLMMRQRPTRG